MKNSCLLIVFYNKLTELFRSIGMLFSFYHKFYSSSNRHNLSTKQEENIIIPNLIM